MTQIDEIVWDEMREDEPLRIVTVAHGSDEWNRVVKKFDERPFYNSDKIIRSVKAIHRIQNREGLKKYNDYKEEMMRKRNNINERQVFHGSKQGTTEIIRDGFKLSFAKLSGLDGKGIYFARFVVRSNNYACLDLDGLHHVFLARVVLGKMTSLVNKEKTGPKQGYDSVAAPRNNNANDFFQCTVYKESATYPEYLISYTVGYQTNPLHSLRHLISAAGEQKGEEKEKDGKTLKDKMVLRSARKRKRLDNE